MSRKIPRAFVAGDVLEPSIKVVEIFLLLIHLVEGFDCLGFEEAGAALDYSLH
ncbi:MAG: hypothetical protein PHC39_04940 [Proteiniphilum sp.]|nr:hypothetical protein [Proteiniphilum sp.]